VTVYSEQHVYVTSIIFNSFKKCINIYELSSFLQNVPPQSNAQIQKIPRFSQFKLFLLVAQYFVVNLDLQYQLSKAADAVETTTL
jgi:hypothetical protein